MIKIIKDEPQVKPILAEITPLAGWLKSSRHGGSLVVPADDRGRYVRVPGSKAARKEGLQRLEELFSLDHQVFWLDQPFFLWHHYGSSPLFAANCMTRLRIA